MNDVNEHDYANFLRSSAPYINTHRGRTFVLMLGGDAIAHPHFTNIVHDCALMMSLGIRLVMVHGARPQIEAALARARIEPRYQQHLRVTDEATMAVIRGVVGDLRLTIEAQLSRGVPGTPMHRAKVRVVSGNFVVAKPHGVLDGADLGYTGTIRRIDAIGIRTQLEQGNIVLISPIGYSPSGEAFNLTSDDLAATVATALLADKLIVLDAQPGVFDSAGHLLTELTPTQLQSVIDEEHYDDISLVRLQALLTAARSGVARCHLVSYIDDGALLTELFTHEGTGTQIADDNYENIRSATLDDVAGIIELIRPLEEQGILVRRPRELLEREIDRFIVAELDGLIIGCAALYPSPEGKIAELACVATHPDYRERHPFESRQSGDAKTLGETLLVEAEERARTMGLSRLFVLTTQTAEWFREHGFRPAEVADLPASKRSHYNQQRNSKVLIKEIKRP